jgi:hypothetical protein
MDNQIISNEDSSNTPVTLLAVSVCINLTQGFNHHFNGDTLQIYDPVTNKPAI